MTGDQFVFLLMGFCYGASVVTVIAVAVVDKLMRRKDYARQLIVHNIIPFKPRDSA